MRKTLLVIGIILVVVCVLSLAFSALNQYSYHHVLDGSSELYSRLQRRAVIFLVTGIVLAAAAAACFIIRSKM